MAPERNQRPGGISLPGMRNSALATAALTSVALFSQNASATPSTGEDGPSRDEVQQRVASLYDAAESATGNYSATRATAKGPRKRAGSVTDGGRGRDTAAARGGAVADDGSRRGGAVADDGSRRGGAATGDGPPPAGSMTGEARADTGPAPADVARQWFDVGRAKLGPTVPAALPADRRSARPAESRPARPAERSAARPGNDLPALERTRTNRPAPELTARSVPALPPAPEAPQATQATQETLKALPAADAELAQSPLRTIKQRIQGKLAAARDLLSAHASSTSQAALSITPLAAIEPAPTESTWGAPAVQTQPTETAWQYEPTGYGTGMAIATGSHGDTGPSVGTGLPSGTGLPAATGLPLGAGMPGGTGLPTDTALPLDTGLPTGTALPGDTSQLAATGLSSNTAWPAAPSRPANTSLPTAPTPPANTSLPTAPSRPTAPAQAVNTPAPTLPTTTALDINQVPPPGPTGQAAKALAFARAQIGRPCVWGAAGPDSYDCSSLTQAAWKAAGVALPRTALAQAGSGTAVSLGDMRPGDLVFFYDDISHVGLHLGNGMMIHAPGPGAYIREESILYAGESAIRGAVRPA
ncbi:C40 family peptidase [Streptomyces sp. SA15]|uniref:C40 family peptidase n=1 Tax=Streptomyces sp. SA15 TaxID=934019 RepID=UPI0015CBF117